MLENYIERVLGVSPEEIVEEENNL